MTARQTRAVFGVAVVLVLGVLAFFAISLADSQSEARADLEEQFAERAQVSAALTEALFGATTGTQAEENAEIYGGPDVDDKTMARQAAQDNNAYQVLVGPRGEVIAKSSATPAEVLDALDAGELGVDEVLEGAPFGLSDIIESEDGTSSMAFSIGIIGPTENRVRISGLGVELIGGFLGGYLGEVPNSEGGNAYVVDSGGVVIASQRDDLAPGAPLDEAGLAAALAEGRSGGAFGPDERFFAADQVDGSTWTVVSTAPESTLFATVRGSSKWVPWLLFGAFALALLTVLLLVRRALQTGAELAASNVSLASARDDLEASNEALERRATELSRSNAELDQFASIASHDLQEPLRKVQAFSSQVISSEEKLSEKGRDYLDRTTSAAERMQDLIQDLLKFSRVATHARPFVETDLNEVTREVLGDLEAVISEAGATVEVGELPTLPADPMQVRQLLQNLISNALKFRRDGVDHRVEVSGSRGERFGEIVVEDNGIGFEPEYSDRIFRVFERLHGRGAYPGTGIGLALCRKIAERHGGTIGAEGVLGEGARFTVRLPVEHEAEPDLSALAEGGSE